MTTGRSHGFAKGSQFQIRRLVNDDPGPIEEQLRQQIPGWGGAVFDWRSPLAAVNYNEYRDGEFLRALGLERYADRLVGAFWPRRGPTWDALARVSLPEPAYLLVEAKSHRAEMTSCYAGGRESLARIEAAFEQARQWLHPPRRREWSAPFYQFANRLAHLYFLRRECGVDARLANVYFTSDPYFPTTREQWENWLAEVRFELGLDGAPVEGLVDVFLPAG